MNPAMSPAPVAGARSSLWTTPTAAGCASSPGTTWLLTIPSGHQTAKRSRSAVTRGSRPSGYGRRTSTRCDGSDMRALTTDAGPDLGHWTKGGRIVYRHTVPAGGFGEVRVVDQDGGN